jgi:NAD(P)-dependent dehydrogenase (short-subunit alcohol dehydrogenase family)
MKMSEQTIGEIAAKAPAAVRVFEKYRIDYCCGGKRQLDEVCRERGISPETILAEVKESSARTAADRDWSQASLSELIGHIVSTHHAYLKTELPLLSDRLARVMKAQKSGAIIQINSKSGKKGSFRNAAYAASKFGGIGLTQSVALELAEFGVRVNAVCPGNQLDSPLWVNSLFKQYAKNQGITEEQVRQKYIDQVPMKRGCTYQDVENVVIFLASDQSSYMTGQAINVTGGQEMR